jgi:hypothetical protein
MEKGIVRFMDNSHESLMIQTADFSRSTASAVPQMPCRGGL